MTDPRVVNAFRRALRDTGASTKVGVALFASGIVETGLRNLNYGDRDSLGPLQQRPSQGWKNPRDPYRAAIDFIDHAKGVEHRYSNPANLAQAVQRSAFPGRYAQHLGEASRLVRGSGGSGRGPGSSAPTTEGPSQPGVKPQNGFDPGSGNQGLSALLAAATAPQRTGPPVTLRPAPAFAASAPLPAGYQGIQASAPPAAQPSMDDRLAQAAQLTQLALPAIRAAKGGAGGSSGPAGTVAVGGARRGQVRVAAGANRAGVGLSGELKHFVSLVSGRARQPITITTGTNHNRLTVNGRVSDHWDGHAGDIAVPVDSAEGDHLASAALQTVGVPKRKAMEMARAGGLFNVNYRGHRVQIIWRTYEGGNHHDHVHIGIR